MSSSRILIKQTGNFCLVYSILNVIPNHIDRCKFLDVNPATTSEDFKDPKCLVPLKTFLKTLPEHKDSTDVFLNGITIYCLKRWIDHLIEKVLLSGGFVSKDYTLSSFLFPLPGREFHLGDMFIFIGYSTPKELGDQRILRVSNGETRSKKRKYSETDPDMVAKYIADNPGDRKTNKFIRTLSEEHQKLFVVLKNYSKDMPHTRSENARLERNPRSKASPLYVSHAVGIAFGEDGVPVLYDPGKRVPHRLFRELGIEALKVFVRSLNEYFGSFRLNLEFA